MPGTLRPKKASYDVGNDAYGRPVTLTYERTYDGKDVWSLDSLPANQRDDGERMRSLSLDNLERIGSIAAMAKCVARR